MGSSASKAARKYPKHPEFPSQAARSVPQTSRSKPVVSQNHLAESRRSEAIERDAADPDFLSNLSRLGPVRVDHHMQAVRPEATNTARLFESRSKSELASSQPAKNTLYAFMLSDLLDKRKSIGSKQDLEVLSKEFGVDIDALDRLTRFVNSPSIDTSSIRPAKGNSEEEGFVATAVWIEPGLETKSA
ncbi:hypothetical protein M413DRAFT_21240 [Hebeloma cylindrosporum]|uniref:Uncharacterized protein n=1 Tax=Hebeloma cylindrosporum TaxID=76867 RepID=A0A0C2YGX0_HEBCY|nr:hypothetical protein M413DRAFT_21240 [Hebeloma cylindrosporum h7]